MSAEWRWRLILVILFAGGFLAVYIPGTIVVQNLSVEVDKEEYRLSRVLAQNSLLNHSQRLQSKIDRLESDPVLSAAPCSHPAGDDAWYEWLERLAARSGSKEIRILGSSRLLVASLLHPAAFGGKLPVPGLTEIEGLTLAPVDRADPAGGKSRAPQWIVSRPLPECPWLQAEWVWDWDASLGALVPISGSSDPDGDRPADPPPGAVIIHGADGKPQFALSASTGALAGPARSPYLKMLLPAFAGGLLVLLIGWFLLLPLRRAWRRIEAETEGAWRRTQGLSGFGTKTQEPPTPETLLRTLSEEALGLAAQAERLAAVAGWKDVGRALGHDIRNALTPLRLTVGTLALKSDDPRLTPALEAAQGSLERVQRLVEEFSHFARLPEGILKIEDLNCTIQSIVDTWPDQDPPKVSFDPYRGGPVSVRMDPGHMDRIVQNLIKNAREAAGSGGSVAVSCTMSGGNARIRFWNSGPAIPDEMIEEIFRQGLSTKPGGQGLGLAIARELVTRMRGVIHAENDAEGGVAFIIELPAVKN